MLSQSKLKILRSLQYSKYRAQEKKILIEGEKLVQECLAGAYSSRFELMEIFALEGWIHKNSGIIDQTGLQAESIDHKQLKQLSNQKTPNQVIAVLKFSDDIATNKPDKRNLYLALDRIQDPGNLGTIFRIAEWYGVHQMFLSEGTADPLNNKVLQSSMGSILRVAYQQVNLPEFLQQLESDITVYGTLLNGKSIYKSSLEEGGIILLGNESQGISADLIQYISNPLLIPRYSKNSKYPESLNAAMAAGIVLSEFRRNMI
jgi:TrmH family RNA methyltransferase